MKDFTTIKKEIAELPKANLYAQCGDESLINYLADLCSPGPGPKYFLDLGAGDGKSLSNTYALRLAGWDGTCFDGGRFEQDHQPIVHEFITLDNIVPLIYQHHGGNPINFLTLDLDGNDFHFLKKILQSGIRPDFLALEINQNFEGEWTIPYTPDFRYKANTDYFGMTFAAACILLEKHGYVPVALLGGQNLYAVHASHLPDEARGYRPAFGAQRMHIPVYGKPWVIPDYE